MSIEDNKAVVRRVEEAWDAGDLAALDELFAPDFVSRSPIRGRPPNLESAKAAHQTALQAFPDRKTTIENMVAEGDQVVVTIRMTGTNHGGLPWLNIRANGAKVDTQWVGFYRVKDGKITEHWAIADVAGMARQLNSAAGNT